MQYSTEGSQEAKQERGGGMGSERTTSQASNSVARSTTMLYVGVAALILKALILH